MSVPESRAERASGVLQTGEMSATRFAEHIDVAHGTIKRWLTEGLPARRNGHRVWINPADGVAWVWRSGGEVGRGFMRPPTAD